MVFELLKFDCIMHRNEGARFCLYSISNRGKKYKIVIYYVGIRLTEKSPCMLGMLQEGPRTGLQENLKTFPAVIGSLLPISVSVSKLTFQ